MKDFYYTHKKLVIFGGIAIVGLVVAVACFAIGSTHGKIGFKETPVSYSGVALQQQRSAVVGRSIAKESGIFPPVPVTPPSSGVIDVSAQRKIIKNASIDMVVKSTENTVEKIKNIAKADKGFVGNATVWEANGEKLGSVTIRVPSDTFGKVLASIKALAVQVTRENINSTDVTEQFIDLQAQLKNYKAAEAQYLKVLNRAYTVKDILAVRKELSLVRGNIERMQGRINYLSRQISMSTISVSLTSEADVKVLGIVWSPWLEVKAGVRNMLASLVGFVNLIIAFVFKLPLIILWLALFSGIVWGGWKSVIIMKRKFF